MRIALIIFASIFSITLQAEIPRVPSSIEIAGVQLKITSDAQEEIQKHVNALRASDKYFQIKLDRVNLYFPIIERVLKEEGVPEDIKYLAIQESALISDAVSSSNAVGYWQFKDFTAREVGLRVDSKVDERKNVVSATHGAAKYFKRNNFFFKNWIYSVSAYQAGPGGAKRYTDKANYGSNKLTITKKTHWYVLKFIAHVIAFKDEVGQPHSEGLKLAEYTKAEGKSIEQVAKEFKADETLTKDYNKWLLHGKVPDDKEYTVIIPMMGKIPKGLEKDNNSSTPSRTIKEPTQTKYPDQIAGDFITKKQAITLKVNGIDATMASRQDNVKSIAQRTGLDPEKFRAYNDMINTEEVETGQIYYIRKKKNKSSILYHVAQYGESMWDISQKYGIKLSKLKNKNRMGEFESLEAGRLMWLKKKRPSKTPIEFHKIQNPRKYSPKENPAVNTRQPIIVQTEPKQTQEPIEEKTTTPVTEKKSTSGTKPTGDKTLHIVQPEETLWSLSKRYNITVIEIAEWNSISPQAALSVGDELIIYRDRSAGSTSSPSTKKAPETKSQIQTKLDEILVHVVAAGESLWSISRKYGVTVPEIRQWNNLNTSDPINPGQKLQIKKSDNAKTNDFTIHVVKGGDSLYQISKKYDMTVEEIMEINHLSSTSLSVGDELKVRKK